AQQARTKAAYEAEAQQRARAEADFAQARRAIEFFEQFSEDELAHNPGLQHVRRRLLETALDYYQDFLAQHDGEPSVHAALASSRARVSQILTELSPLQGPTLLTILQDPAVQEDLGLDADQKAQLARLAPRDFELLAKEYWESFTLDPKERRAKGLQAARAA